MQHYEWDTHFKLLPLGGTRTEVNQNIRSPKNDNWFWSKRFYFEWNISLNGNSPSTSNSEKIVVVQNKSFKHELLGSLSPTTANSF